MSTTTPEQEWKGPRNSMRPSKCKRCKLAPTMAHPFSSGRVRIGESFHVAHRNPEVCIGALQAEIRRLSERARQGGA